MEIRKIGFFKELRHGDSSGPSLSDQEGLGEEEKAIVLDYIRTGRVLAASGQLWHDVLGSDEYGGLDLMTDGEWVWYSDLYFYLEKYDVRIEPEFVQKATRVRAVSLSDEALIETAREFRGY